MHYGHPKHIPSPEDLTVLYCRCGWHSKELTVDELASLGAPWGCKMCGQIGSNMFWITFHPRERREAYSAAHLPMPGFGKATDAFAEALSKTTGHRISFDRDWGCRLCGTTYEQFLDNVAPKECPQERQS